MLNQRASIRRRSAEASDIFLENTSFAVIRQIGSSSSSAQKNCWKVLCAILGGCLLYHIFEMIRGYQEYQSMTATREKHAERDGIPFPSFTFCNMGKFFNRHKKLANERCHVSYAPTYAPTVRPHRTAPPRVGFVCNVCVRLCNAKRLCNVKNIFAKRKIFWLSFKNRKKTQIFRIWANNFFFRIFLVHFTDQ